VKVLLATAAVLVLAAASAKAATLTVYSSMPLVGRDAPEAKDIVRAEQLALSQAGPIGVRLRSLNDATRAADSWDPSRVALDARTAAFDPTTIAYLGEYNSGGSAVSIPIINQLGALQISPDNTYPGLTERTGLRGPGEPDKYYPTGERTFGRLIPTDVVQAGAIAASIREQRVQRVLLVDDGDLYGHELAILVRRRLSGTAIRTIGPLRFRTSTRQASAIARRLRAGRADAAFFGGVVEDHPDRLWRALHRSRPAAKLFGPDGLTDEGFARRLRGSLARSTFLTSTALPQRAYPPAAQPFFAAFRQRYGRAPHGFAIDGYEAMRLVLDDIAAARRAIAPSTDLDALRPAVLAQFFATRDRASPLGTYSIAPTGDTTLGRIGAYRVTAAGRLRFDHVIDVPGP
jgi:branched-chain amino acid transport system substrate-binding protein